MPSTAPPRTSRSCGSAPRGTPTTSWSTCTPGAPRLHRAAAGAPAGGSTDGLLESTTDVGRPRVGHQVFLRVRGPGAGRRRRRRARSMRSTAMMERAVRPFTRHARAAGRPTLRICVYISPLHGPPAARQRGGGDRRPHRHRGPGTTLRVEATPLYLADLGTRDELGTGLGPTPLHRRSTGEDRNRAAGRRPGGPSGDDVYGGLSAELEGLRHDVEVWQARRGPARPTTTPAPVLLLQQLLQSAAASVARGVACRRPRTGAGPAARPGRQRRRDRRFPTLERLCGARSARPCTGSTRG